MKPKVVAYKTLPDDVLAYLREHVALTVIPSATGRPKAELAQALEQALVDADGAIGASVKITPAMLDGARRLKVCSTISVGIDNFDVDDLTRRGIVLAHTPDVLTESTADTVFALILATARRIVELAEWVKAGHWHGSIGEAQYGVDVNGKTLGIVGLGRIGKAVAQRVHGFEVEILAYRERNQTEAIINNLAAVGIKAKLSFPQYAAMREAIRANKAQLAHQTWGSFSVNDVSASTPVYFGFEGDDITHDAEVRDLLVKGNTSVDPKARKQAYKNALTLIAQRAEAVPLWSLPVFYVAAKDLNFKAYPDEMPRFWEMAWK